MQIKDKFIIKINDFVKHASVAAKHYHSGLYSDKSINCRKAGEVACKVILYHSNAEKLAGVENTIIEQSTLIKFL